MQAREIRIGNRVLYRGKEWFVSLDRCNGMIDLVPTYGKQQLDGIYFGGIDGKSCVYKDEVEYVAD